VRGGERSAISDQRSAGRAEPAAVADPPYSLQPAAYSLFFVLAAGCADPPSAGPLPPEATAHDVVIESDGLGAAAAVLRFGASKAEAEEVAVVQAPSDEPPLDITALKSSWDLKARTAHFEGNVVVTRAEVKIHCAALDVRYADANRIATVVASGGVTVNRDGRTARADTAELDGPTGRITLTGNPRLSEGPNTLVGTRIELWLDDERATCEGAGDAPCALTVAGSALRSP
jgi:lipopolysaccharide export system protein LptA